MTSQILFDKNLNKTPVLQTSDSDLSWSSYRSFLGNHDRSTRDKGQEDKFPHLIKIGVLADIYIANHGLDMDICMCNSKN